VEYDLVVIGSGPAGEKAAVQAAYHGRRVALVEQAELTGGVGVTHVGMIPTKTLREAALYVTGFRKRDLYGLSVDLDPTAVYSALRKRTNEVIASMAALVRQNLDRHGVDVIRGRARLAGGGVVQVSTGQRLLADNILIATGSRPYHPPGIPFDDPDVLDAEGLLEIETSPASFVVVGGGAIGCEHASIFNALGSHVTLVDRGQRLLSYVDAELSQLLGATFADLGMTLALGRAISTVIRDEAGLQVVLDNGTVLRPEKVLVASGRSGNTEDLGLEEAGVLVNERGQIVVDTSFRTTAAGVFAAGDVIGSPALASAAMEQGRVASAAAIGVTSQTMVDATPTTGIYSIPEIASVGLTEEKAAAQNIPIKVGRFPFRPLGRAMAAGEATGFVKVLYHADNGALVGAHMIGPAVTDLIAELTLAKTTEVNAESLVYTIHAHPTFAEAIKGATEAALGIAIDL
jgi:pyruvate/2-oxoglutarate dehydrogenase complex dihydrolipoamide dehydrogenase (E3) component